MRMAEGEGLRKSRPANKLEYLTRPNGPIDRKGKFRGLSNREGPPEKKTAAPVAPGSGGKIGKAASNSRGASYSTPALRAMGGAA